MPQSRPSFSLALGATIIAGGLIGVTTSSATATPGALDPAFTPAVLNEAVFAVAELSGGKSLVSGQFTDVAGHPATDFITRLNSDGSRDNTFAPPSLNWGVWSIAALPDGKSLIGGGFSNVDDDANHDFLARLNGDGSLDSSFTPPNLSGAVRMVAALPNGQSLVGGDFTDVAGNASHDHLVKLDINGSRNTGFTPPTLNGGMNAVSAIAVLRSGKYLIGGKFTNANGHATADYLARLNVDGSLDTNFTPAQLNDSVRSLVELPSGKLLVGGSFTGANGDTGIDRLVRLNPDGSRDTSFTPPALSSTVLSMAVLKDNKYLIGGDFQNVDGYNAVDYLVRLNPNGSRDTSFAPPTLDRELFAVAEVSGGKYLIGGHFQNAGGSGAIDYLARLLPAAVAPAPPAQLAPPAQVDPPSTNIPAPTTAVPGKVTKAKKVRVTARKAKVRWKKPQNISDMSGIKFHHRIKAKSKSNAKAPGKKQRKWNINNAADLAAKKGWYVKSWKKLTPNTRHVVHIFASNSAGESKVVAMRFTTKKKK